MQQGTGKSTDIEAPQASNAFGGEGSGNEAYHVFDETDLRELEGGEYDPDQEDEGFSYGSFSESEATGPPERVTYQDVGDTEPLRRFVTRTKSFTKEDFDALLSSPGMFAVKDHLLQGASTLGRMGGMTTRRRLLRQRTSIGVGGTMRRNRKKNPRSCLGIQTLRPDNSWYMTWSALILCLDLTYSAFVVPISIGMMTSFFSWNWTSIFDYGAGLFFVTDLILNFHVGFIATYNMHKVMVLNPRLIAKFYMSKGSFISDAFSSFAWFGQILLVIIYKSNTSAFNPNTVLYVMEGIRLMRFVRVVRLIKHLLQSCIYASISFDNRFLKFLGGGSMYIIFIIYIILILVNFVGCIWNFMAGVYNFDNTWVNYYVPFIREYGDSPDSYALTPEEARQVSDVWRFTAGCYWALTTITGVGYGDIVPSSLAEMIVAMCTQVVGVMFFGLLLSTISELLQQVNRNARRLQAFRNKMELVERWIEQYRLPRRLRRKIKTFYAEVWLRQSENREETSLYLELPHVLRNEVSWHVNNAIFRSLPMLKDVDDKTLYLIASKMTPYRFGPGMDLCSEGDMADRLWVLLEGETVALYHFNEAEHVEGPAVIGDFVLLQEADSHFTRFPCTYRTITNCTVWMIEWKDLKLLLAYRPQLQERMAVHVQRALAERITQYPHLWAPSLQKMSLPAETVKHHATSPADLSSGHLHRASASCPADIPPGRATGDPPLDPHGVQPSGSSANDLAGPSSSAAQAGPETAPAARAVKAGAGAWAAMRVATLSFLPGMKRRNEKSGKAGSDPATPKNGLTGEGSAAAGAGIATGQAGAAQQGQPSATLVPSEGLQQQQQQQQQQGQGQGTEAGLSEGQHPSHGQQSTPRAGHSGRPPDGGSGSLLSPVEAVAAAEAAAGAGAGAAGLHETGASSPGADNQAAPEPDALGAQPVEGLNVRSSAVPGQLNDAAEAPGLVPAAARAGHRGNARAAAHLAAGATGAVAMAGSRIFQQGLHKAAAQIIIPGHGPHVVEGPQHSDPSFSALDSSNPEGAMFTPFSNGPAGRQSQTPPSSGAHPPPADSPSGGSPRPPGDLMDMAHAASIVSMGSQGGYASSTAGSRTRGRQGSRRPSSMRPPALAVMHPWEAEEQQRAEAARQRAEAARQREQQQRGQRRDEGQGQGRAPAVEARAGEVLAPILAELQSLRQQVETLVASQQQQGPRGQESG